MAEWSIAAVLKTAVLKGTGGSNPSLSAKNPKQSSEKQCIIVLSGLLRKLATCLSKIFQCVAFGTEAMTSDSKRHFRLFDDTSSPFAMTSDSKRHFRLFGGTPSPLPMTKKLIFTEYHTD